ncbi:MAG: 3,4-dihydroxyphenylacetate 2,3-dioxygenase, partial [Rhodobacteraceae bacterium]|nr:3,4-dihydroxyphenylacetate 2,3-dioxygenase [Paracoccaceae bacterium]
MGEIVLAAKMTHVPTMLLSEQPGPVEGKRQPAIDGHREIARRAKALGADTVVICDTHWVVNAGYHINANHRFQGLFTSNEFPQFIQDLEYSYDGNPELGDRIAAKACDKGVHTLSHQIDSLELEYGTLVPMRFMGREADFKVVSVAAWCTVHSHDSSRKRREAIREAIEESDNKVLLVASGSLSHRIWPN